MKLLTNLSGTLTDGDYHEPRGALTTLHAEPLPGVHVKVVLGAAGIVFIRGDQRIALPLDAQIKLIAQQCPEFLAAIGDPSPVKPTVLQQKVKEILSRESGAVAKAGSKSDQS